MKILVIGLGYVGLSLAVTLASKHSLIGYDVDENKINLLKNKISPLKEKDVQLFLNRASNFTLTNNLDDAINESDLIVIALPTNFDETTNSFNVSIVSETLEHILSKNKNVDILIKSTVPSGYTSSLASRYKTDNIYFSPEFLREGHSISDTLSPTRIIVGYSSNKDTSIKKAHQIATLMLDNCLDPTPVSVIPSSEAEAVKLFSNTYLAMRIAFFNELDTYAESKGLDTKRIIDNVCLDPRIASGYNNPSFGYGGYCLPKDTKQLKANFDLVPETLISAITESNSLRKEFIANQIISKINSGDVVGVYLLAMKKDSDNFRESSVIDIIKILKSKGINLLIYEPAILEESYLGIKVLKNLDEFINKTNLVIANRIDKNISKCHKIYTRDLYRKD